MNLVETLLPLLPLTPTGSMTLKADHPRRVWELDETYHTASQASFRRTTWQRLNYTEVVFRFCSKAAMFENGSQQVP